MSKDRMGRRSGDREKYPRRKDTREATEKSSKILNHSEDEYEGSRMSWSLPAMMIALVALMVFYWMGMISVYTVVITTVMMVVLNIMLK